MPFKMISFPQLTLIEFLYRKNHKILRETI